jgi:hypothetical protein
MEMIGYPYRFVGLEINKKEDLEIKISNSLLVLGEQNVALSFSIFRPK